MRFEEWIGCSEERRKKYEYYLELGYSEEAAQVLSTVTYGDEDLCFLVKRFSKNNTIENLHAWLRSREEADPEEAIPAFREEELSPPDAGQDLPDSAFYRTKSLCCFDALSAAPEEETCLFDLDEEEDDAGNSGLFSMAIGRLASPSAGAFSLAEELSSDEYEPIEEESAKKNVRISELEARVEELEKMLIAKGSTVTIHQNNGIVGDDVVAHDVAIGKEGGSDAGNS